MKKILFYAACAAFLAGCAEDELDSYSAQNGGVKGISFENVLETPSTRGELTLDDNVGFFWYAEQDKISIYAENNVTGTKGVTTDWGTLLPAPAQYKATVSAGRGQFTSVDNDNLLTFTKVPTSTEVEAKTTTFVALYGSSLTGATKTEDNKKIKTIKIKPAKANAEITFATGENISHYMPMYSVSYAHPTENYHSVGEKVGLTFYRPFATLGVVAKGVAQYEDIFGALKNVKIESKGAAAEVVSENSELGAQKLSYDTDTECTFDVETKTASATGGTMSASIKVNYPANFTWKDGYASALLMPALNVDRKKFRDAKVNDNVEVTYEFEKITFVEPVETNEDWSAFTAEGNPTVKEVNTLDISKYSYLVTNKSADKNDRALIVNGGEGFEFSDIFADAANVKWNNANVLATEFETIIVNEGVTLSDEEMLTLSRFTNLKSIKLAENTAIKANVFKGVTALESIEMPKVTEIAADAFKSGVALKTVKLPAYEFESKAINNVLLNSTSLVTLDMSAVKTMKSVFPAEGFSLSGFTNLADITVNSEGLAVGSASFKGCTALETINGKINISEGAGAFEGSGITEIELANTDIPANAFKNCADLLKVTYKSELLAPTKVGNAAFSGCTSLINMDLSKIAGEGSVIGESAFEGCTDFVGMPDATRNINVLYVGAKTIKKNAFKNCEALKYVQFTHATAIEDGILSGTNVALNEVKFKEVLTSAVGSATMFGESTNVAKTILFLNPEQPLDYYEGNEFYPMGNKNTGGAVKVTFNSIIFE